MTLTKINKKEVKQMGIRKSTDGGGIRHGKPWWKRWSRDDTELFVLSLPTHK